MATFLALQIRSLNRREQTWDLGQYRIGSESLIEINEETPSSRQHPPKVMEIRILHTLYVVLVNFRILSREWSYTV